MKIMRSTAFLLTFFLLGITGLSSAEDVPLTEVTSFDIPSQNLETALIRFSEQTDLQLVMASEEVSGKEAKGISGEWSRQAALDELLDSTGLRYQFVNDNTVAIGTAYKGGDSDSKKLPTQLVLTAQVTSSAQSANPVERDDDTEVNTTDTDPIQDAALLKLPEIIVIGESSNFDIQRTIDDIQPYVVFDADTIRDSGALDLAQFLKTRLPMNTLQTDFGQRNETTLGNISQIDLRGLGTDQTLILLNGRRLPSVATSNSFLQPDISGIPVSSIERIEVLPTTASGIYGGGATGGAINIITRNDYSGAELEVTYGDTFDTAAASRRFDLTAGTSLFGGRTSVQLHASYSETDPLEIGARDFADRARALLFENNPSALTSTFFPPVGSQPNVRSIAGTNLTLDDGTDLGSSIAHVPVGYPGALVAGDGGQAFLATAGVFDLTLPNDANGKRGHIVHSPAKSSVSLRVRHDFTDRLFGFLDFAAYRNEGEFFRSSIPSGFLLEADAPNNPFQQMIAVSSLAPGASHGPSGSDSKIAQITAGVFAELPKDWTAGVDVGWNEGSFESWRSINGFLTSEFFAGQFSGSNPDLDVLRDQNIFPIDFSPFQNATPTNWLGPRDTKLRTAGLRLAGPLITLRQRPVSLSMLYEYRNEEIANVFSDATAASGAVTVSYTPARKQVVNSLYAEMQIPLIASEDKVSGVHAFDM